MDVVVRILEERIKGNTHVVVPRTSYENHRNKSTIDLKFKVIFHIKRGDMNFTIICF